MTTMLINRMKRANNIANLPKHKREDGKFLTDCLTDVARKVEELKGLGGAANVIHSQLTGRSGSTCHRRLMKAFDDIILANQPNNRRASVQQQSFSSNVQPHFSSNVQPSFIPASQPQFVSSSQPSFSGNSSQFYAASSASHRQPPPRRSNNRSAWFSSHRGRSFNPTKDTCYKCGKVGHMSRNCDNIKVEKD